MFFFVNLNDNYVVHVFPSKSLVSALHSVTVVSIDI